MVGFLLQTKLHIPNVPAEFVYRSALANKMDLTLQRKLCLISTPAGYGKTTLIVSWAKRQEQPLAWVSLDEGDNNFTRFFAYILAAIQKQIREFEPGLLERLTSPQGVPHELFMTLLINALERIDQTLILVLDDYHCIREAEIHEAVQYLLDNLPPQIHLIIASREEPPFSITNLRARNQLVEIQYSELRFSEGDAFEYLNRKMGLNLSSKEVRTLVEYTEGWIVGLHLAALALSTTDKKSLLISQMGLADRYIAGYLFDEVLQRQSKEIQSFLLQSSVLDQFTASLCDAVLGLESSRLLIAEIEQLNLFLVPLDDQQEWYRYHHRFAEMLYDRLKKTEPTLINEIYQRASQWFEEQGFVEEAIEYAMRAQDYGHAAQLLDQIGESLFWTGNPKQVLNWLEVLPEALYYQHPSLWLLHLWAHITLAQFSIVADELASLRHEVILAHISVAAVRKSFESSLAVIQALMAINLKYDIDTGLKYARLGMENENIEEDDVESIMALLVYGKACMLNGDLDLAEKFLDESSRLIAKTQSPFMMMIATHHRSELASFRGDLRKSENLLKEAHRLGVEHHLDDASAFFRICIDIGRLNYERNNLIVARQCLAMGVRGGERALIAYDLLDGYCALFDLARLERDFDKAEEIITKVEYLSNHSGFAQAILDRAAAMKTRLAIDKGNWYSVRQWLSQQNLEAGYGFCQKYEARTAIQALVALKEFERTEMLLRDLLSMAVEHQWLMDIVHYRAWLASVLYQQGNLRAARLALQKAVRISAHQNYVRSILDVGDPIIALLEHMLREIPPEWKSWPAKDYLQVLINARSSTARPDLKDWAFVLASDLAEPLTDQETKVLELLAKGHRNPEIAETMIISESTVKYHLKNIYLKLGVHTRTQAIIRAKELRLI